MGQTCRMRPASKRTNIADLLAMPGAEDIELPLMKAKDLARPADFG